MKFLCFVALLIAVLHPIGLSQTLLDWKCAVPDTPRVNPQPYVGQTMPLVVVFVDFVDGRKPGGLLPTVDADTSYFRTNDSVNAVGGTGWQPDALGILQKQIRKYV